MPAAPRALLSGPDRPLRLRKRPDLTAQLQSYLGRRSWVVKDPLAQKYYRFEEEEYTLLQQMDGRRSLVELQQEFERRFAPQRIRLHELHQLVGMFHRNCLVVADVPGQGEALYRRGRERRRRERLAGLANVLAVRFKGIDPDRLLTRLDYWCGWLFSIPCLLVSLMLATTALLLLASHFETFQHRLPAFQDFFGTHNWIWLAATLAATKVLHEFGHGLACKRFGGECHEMGVMLLVLTPCLYCNVSDSWMLPDKWKRAAIGAAGMYVEMVLASLAFFVWWFSQPGMVHYLALNVMFICSVTTLLFNANPLLRYDGYYILSDLVEIPNLRQKATTILHRKAGAWLLGLPEPPDPFLPARRQMFFAAYAVAAAIYRWLVVIGILWFLYRIFEPYGLQVAGQMLVLVTLYGMLVHPCVQLAKYFRVPGRIEQVHKPRMIAAAAAGAVLVAAVCFVSLPHYVRCHVVLQPRDAAVAYVEAPGTLQRIHVQPGDWVPAGQPLVELDNRELELTVIRLESELHQQASKLDSLRQRAFEEESAALEIAEAEEALAATREQLAQRRRQLARLTITAPVPGYVLPLERVPADSPEGHLRRWAGSPLEPHNLQAFLGTGDAICRIGDPHRMEAVLVIDQGDLEFVRPGQQVDIVLETSPGRRLRTVLGPLSQLDLDALPTSLSSKAGGHLASQTTKEGSQRPLSASYQSSAPLDDPSGLLVAGATGQARVLAGRQTLAQRAWRFLCQTFNFSV